MCWVLCLGPNRWAILRAIQHGWACGSHRPAQSSGADTAGWILRGGIVNRYDSASWDVGKQQVCVGEGFLHGSGRDSKDQALKDFH